MNKSEEEMKKIVERGLQTQRLKYGDIYTRTKEGKEKSIAWMHTKSTE